MTSATRVPLRVATRQRPGRASGGRCLRSFACGLTAVAVAVVIAVTALASAGRVLAVSVDARLETRSLVGLTRQSGLSWFAQPDEGMIPQSDMAAIGSAATMPAPDTAGTPDLFADQIHTGSIGQFVSIFDATDAALAGRFSGSQPRDDATPLPRARPQLAALPPGGGIGIVPDEEARTAIYDITARTVYMPNGERLEAHSGFGQYMDDPKHVRLRMRGVTPPNTYKLTMREALFHGVQALRMTPVGDGEMFGRAGILAHNYLLGPNGQSNGCVSIKDYAKFLAAFQRGEVDRIVVVERLAKPPSFFARRNIKSAANTH